MRDDLRGYVQEHSADPGVVLVVDETGDLKWSTAMVGAQRQCTGTAGRRRAILTSAIGCLLACSWPVAAMVGG
jgi:hypothetical protein